MRLVLIDLLCLPENPLADANHDGKINMGDVVRIELIILGLI
jgi:hypothetical protein